MQFRISCTVLLASLAALLSFSDIVVDAAPVKRNAGMVSLPLKRVEARSGVHPQVMYQQHINRGHRRFARMAGFPEPSASELESNLVRRIVSAGEAELAKRYNRGGINPNSKRFDRAGLEKLSSFKDLEEVEGADTLIAALNVTADADEDNVNNAAVNAPPIGDGSGATDPNAPNLTVAKKPSAPNSLGLDIEANDVGYLATVQIGSPPRDFSILMDSGSADLWVGAEDCQSEEGGGCGNHQFLGPESSTSFEVSNTDFQITYGTGAVSGKIVRDNINVAGLKLNAHVFGAASVESREFTGGVSFDGLMGLAQSTLSNQNVLTPVEALAQDGLIRDAITSYKISRLEDGKNDGVITFGGLDTSKFDAKTLVTVNNVNQLGFWEADMPEISVDGKNAGLQGRTAILDTGTTLVIAPRDDAEAVHALVPGSKSDGQGGFTVPCNTKAQIALQFGNRRFTIDPRDLAFAPLSDDPAGDCLSGISSGQVGDANAWLVGDVFLKSAYFSHDVTKNSISLAKLV